MRRREFIAALGGAAAWPLAARAQQAGVPVIGVLSSGRPDDFNDVVATFRKGLAEWGNVVSISLGEWNMRLPRW